jgi:hypothetical protein
MKHAIVLLFNFIALAAWSQVQVDKPIQLTGSGGNAKVTGIEEVNSAEDATSAESIQKNAVTYAAATNSGNAYAVTLVPAPGAYTTGMMVHFKASAANTGTATLNVNGLGVSNIRKNFDVPLVANDIKSGQMVSVIYDGSLFQMLTPSGNASTGPASVNVGDLAQGGKIVAVWNGGLNGAAVATSDEAGFYCPWQAFTACGSKTTGGMYDWQLPPAAMLDLLYTNRVSIGGFTTDYYWGTDRHSGNTDGGYAKSFNDGSQYVPCNGGPQAKVRCIRFF